MKVTRIVIKNNGLLGFGHGQLATVDEYEKADRCVGSIFEALNPDEIVHLKEGFFILDNDLDLRFYLIHQVETIYETKPRDGAFSHFKSQSNCYQYDSWYAPASNIETKKQVKGDHLIRQGCLLFSYKEHHCFSRI